jgi:hypothetical protein
MKQDPTVEIPAGEHRGSRCPICFWALYDGTFCQGPEWCSNKWETVTDPVYLTNEEAGRAAALKVITPTKEMMKWLRDTGDGRKKI